MIDKHTLVKDKLDFFSRYSNQIQSTTGRVPGYYFVTVRPEEGYIKALPVVGSKYVPELKGEYNRLDFVERLVQSIIYRIQSELIKKPTKRRSRPLLIRSRNDIESKTRSGEPDIHHSHGIWAVHPDINFKFQKLLVPMASDDASCHPVDKSKCGNNLFLNESMYLPLKDFVHSVHVEPCSNLEPLLDYSAKHFSADDPVNSWGTFDTPTFGDNK